MPLPAGDRRTSSEPWPPLDNQPALNQMAVWSAWFSGDLDDLATVYAHRDARMTSTGLPIRPSQYSGGLRGVFARTFWGAPPPAGQPSTKMHIPLPSDIAMVSSRLLFAEPITIKDEHSENQGKFEELLEESLHAQLLEAAEVGSGLGGVYLRSVWDKDVNKDGPWVSAIHGDAAIPTWSYGRLKATTFWRILKQENDIVVRALERHEVGVIYHAVYQGSATTLGIRMPLSDYPETEELAKVVSEDGSIPTGIDLLTAAYVPNMRPNRSWRDQPANAPLGRSDYSAVEPIFDALDECWTSWMRDIRLGRGRVFVPGVYLDDLGPGKGAAWDPEREVYESLKMLPDQQSGNMITVAQFDIRVDEHERTALALMKNGITTAGYSQQSFGLAGDVTAVTATEVAVRKEASLATRDVKSLYWRPAIRHMLRVTAEVGRAHFGWSTSGEKKPDVIFPEAVQPDPEVVARTIQLLDAATAVSTETKVMLANPDRKDDAKWIKEEVRKILEEAGKGPYADPGTFTGSPGDQAPPPRPGDGPPKPTQPGASPMAAAAGAAAEKQKQQTRKAGE